MTARCRVRADGPNSTPCQGPARPGGREPEIMAKIKGTWWTTGLGLLALVLCLAAAASLQAQGVAAGPGVPPPPAVTIGAPTVAPPADAAAPQGNLLSTTDLWKTMRDGGPLMVAIAACSFLLDVRVGTGDPVASRPRDSQALRDGASCNSCATASWIAIRPGSFAKKTAVRWPRCLPGR